MIYVIGDKSEYYKEFRAVKEREVVLWRIQDVIRSPSNTREIVTKIVVGLNR